MVRQIMYHYYNIKSYYNDQIAENIIIIIIIIVAISITIMMHQSFLVCVCVSGSNDNCSLQVKVSKAMNECSSVIES